tara:strand:- start:1557 stop:2981 length:1425 start_codon:yes stop_codon:yes gene_type:complete
MDTFYWHDYETWGVNPASDMPSQFAGVRTDMNFNIIGQPLNILCKPSLDVIPHAEACMVTGMTPQQVEQQGVSEREFFAAIHYELAQPQTCGVGYNSIRFDDEVTRYGLYRNFYDPYAREWENNNSRWDIIDMARLCYALRPDGIHWPQRDDGTVSFRLEDLTVANNLEHHSAHDALSDVYATIAVAKLIKQKQPELFQHIFELRKKLKVSNLLELGAGKPILHISSRFGPESKAASLVLPVAQSLKNKNEIICLDLRYSPDPVLNLPIEELSALLFTRAKDLPSGIDRIPIKSIHINKCPIVLTPKLLNATAAKRLNLDLEVCERHRQRYLASADLPEKLQQVIAGTEYDNTGKDAEALLYDGFIPNNDKRLMASVVSASASELSDQVFPFQDARLVALLFRYRARNFPSSLTAEEQQDWIEFCRDKCLHGVDNRLEKERDNIQQLKVAKPEKTALLDQLNQYLEDKFRQLSS